MIPPLKRAGLLSVGLSFSLFAVACREQAPTQVPQTPIALQESQTDQPPPISDGEHGTTGDSPLTSSFTFTGNNGLAVDVVPFSFATFSNATQFGTFVITGIPGGSTVLKALMYVQRWDAPATTASAVLSANALGPTGAFAVDPAGGFLLQSYRFDFTSIVTGNGSFPFSFTTAGGGTFSGQNYYAALVVVFSHPSEPVRTIVLNDGSEAIGTGSSTTSFSRSRVGNVNHHHPSR
ncbi:MAG: DUF3344 domain-containing protein [Candidatus Methylomirabilaceae bacterium]